MNAEGRPLLLASAPNGAYKNRRDHGAIPLSAAQLADTAAAVMQAGARMLHLHVRDANGRHTLDAAAYRAAIAAIRARVGRRLFIQCTSEAAGIYSAAEQNRAVRALACEAGVDGVSVAVRELAGGEADAGAAGALFHHLARRNILAQYILYCAADLERYAALRRRNIIPPARHSVLLVIGKRGAGNGRPSVIETLRRMAGALPAALPWMVCAFGEGEFECLTEATRLGGHVRVGFENTLRLRCGRMAADNRQLVTQLIESGNPRRRPLADLRQARVALGGEPCAGEAGGLATPQPGDVHGV